MRKLTVVAVLAQGEAKIAVDEVLAQMNALNKPDIHLEIIDAAGRLWEVI